MPTTISWEGLRDLAGFRAERGCAISLYLDLDPSVSPTAGDAATRMSSLLDAAERAGEATRADLAHDERQALRGDVERIRRYFDEEFNRDGARGLALFCAALGGLWRPLVLTGPVPDEVRVGSDLYLVPLVPLVGQGEGVLVAVVGRERGELYRLRDGRLEEVADRSEHQPRRHDQGGRSQARIQRHIDQRAADHLRDVAQELDAQVRSLGHPGVVVVCSEQTRAELSEFLSSEVRGALMGWAHAEAHAGPPGLFEAVSPVLEEWRAGQEGEALDRWREEAGRGGKGASGWAPTLEAVSDGRVELLLYSEGVHREAWRCPACGRLAAEAGACPLDGEALESGADGIDLAVHRTLAHGGRVCVARHRRDLDPVEGIGALLRY